MAAVSNNEESGGRGTLDEMFLLVVIAEGGLTSSAVLPNAGRRRGLDMGAVSDGKVIGATEHAATIRRAQSRCSSRSSRRAKT